MDEADNSSKSSKKKVKNGLRSSGNDEYKVYKMYKIDNRAAGFWNKWTEMNKNNVFKTTCFYLRD